MPDSAVTELSAAAESILAAARDHKRAAESHRRQARALMQRYGELRRDCERRGIQLTITESPSRRETE